MPLRHNQGNHKGLPLRHKNIVGAILYGCLSRYASNCDTKLGFSYQIFSLF
ncbi:MAG: hypothetical protein KAI83_04710 [Thiomargarita sp.]|nr:hypothetical protein [Thiomargarita sp.]